MRKFEKNLEQPCNVSGNARQRSHLIFGAVSSAVLSTDIVTGGLHKSLNFVKSCAYNKQHWCYFLITCNTVSIKFKNLFET